MRIAPMLRHALVALALFSGVAAVHAESPNVPDSTTAYTQQIQQLRAARVARLNAPSGWLSLIGLEWLKVGDNRVGAAADNDIVLKAGPAHLGTVTEARTAACTSCWSRTVAPPSTARWWPARR
jgi:hypothetical protein